LQINTIIKFFSHLNQSLSKLKSTKFAPPPCTPSQGVSSTAAVHFSRAESECMCVFLLSTSAPPFFNTL
jgi:hypothetical protein